MSHDLVRCVQKELNRCGNVYCEVDGIVECCLCISKVQKFKDVLEISSAVN